MLKTRSYEMVRSSGNLIQWRKSLFDTVLVYNNKNKPMLRYKFGSVYMHLYVNIYLYVCMRIYVCVYTYLFMDMHVYVCIYVCVYT